MASALLEIWASYSSSLSFGLSLFLDNGQIRLEGETAYRDSKCY